MRAALGALSDLRRRLEPRADGLALAACKTGVHLLERLHLLGREGQQVVVGALAHLACGLGEDLLAPEAAPAPALPAAPSVAQPGLSLAYGGIGGGELGELMVRMGFLTRDQADAVARMQGVSSPPRPFGELAIELGYVGTAEVRSALRIQARASGRVPSVDDKWGVRPL